jgi:hypothetical protein
MFPAFSFSSTCSWPHQALKAGAYHCSITHHLLRLFLFVLMLFILSSGLASAIKSSTPAASAINGCQRIISGYHHRFTPIFLKRSKRSFIPV